ncbi:hypothetical protein J6590_076462 [Homalodisca vitripennis]|nr:hypothetical protein J6590_076462 [Homalodisca vitripennis]
MKMLKTNSSSGCLCNSATIRCNLDEDVFPFFHQVYNCVLYDVLDTIAKHGGATVTATPDSRIRNITRLGAGPWGIHENEKADILVKKGAESIMVGSEPGCGIALQQ